MINEKLARKYCSEDISKIEGYQEAISDEIEVWDTHHRREIDEGLSSKELLKRGEYFSRPASELIFLPKHKHMRLHNRGERSYLFGKHLSAATKKKLSDALSGERNPLFGKHRSEETKKKIAQAQSGEKSRLFGTHISDETRRKLSEYHWWNNGVKSVFAKSCPPGFVKGRKFFH